MIDGRLIRPIAIRHPGMFLSHPGMVTRPSYHCPRVTVSIESAMRSRDWSENDMPSVPIDMPSDTPTVLKRIPFTPTASTPSFTFAARSSRCMLQLLPSYQMLAIPICALSRSASVNPVAKSWAWDAPWDLGWVMRALKRLIGTAMTDSGSGGGGAGRM